MHLFSYNQFLIYRTNKYTYILWKKICISHLFSESKTEFIVLNDMIDDVIFCIPVINLPTHAHTYARADNNEKFFVITVKMTSKN